MPLCVIFLSVCVMGYYLCTLLSQKFTLVGDIGPCGLLFHRTGRD